jgi:transposase
MLSLPLPVRILVCTKHADMRRSFDGLAALVREYLGVDPLSGHLFVFRNRRGDRVKLLYWDEDGYAIWYKRLEEGVFAFPDATHRSGVPGGEHGLPMRAADLAMLLDGVDLASVRRGKRYQRPAQQRAASA